MNWKKTTWVLALCLVSASRSLCEVNMSLLRIISHAGELGGTEVVTRGFLHVPREGMYHPSLYIDEAAYANMMTFNSVSLRVSDDILIDGKQVKRPQNSELLKMAGFKYVEIKGVIPADLKRKEDFSGRARIVDVKSIEILPGAFNQRASSALAAPGRPGS